MDPYIFGKILDRFASRPQDYSQDEYLKGVGLLVGAAVGVAMISRIAKAFQDYFVNLIIQKLGADLFTDGVAHTLQLPFQEFEDQRSGELLNILQKVRSDSERFIFNFINIFFVAIVGIVFVIIYAVQVEVWLIVVYFVAAFVLGTVTNVLSKKIKKVQKTIVAETKVLAGTTTESIRNIELVKSMGLTEQEVNRLNQSTQKILGLELKKVRDIRSVVFVQGTMVNLLRQSILYILLFLIFKDSLTIGQLMTLQFYSFFIFNPLQEMGNVILSYREAEASLEQFQQITSKAIEKQPTNPEPLSSIDQLKFDKVSFQHKSANNKALNQVSFEVRKGETIAFVGPSGSGKTTLVKLLVGLYDSGEGEILLNKTNILKFDKQEFRKRLGFVSQDTQLFAGTIRENLLFVKPDASEKEMFEALDMASCQNLLARSEKGIDTVIGEGGMKISGGEKQRLCIARSLLRKPHLLIFDEATSALDSLTEDEITQTVRKLSQNSDIITVLIAHRLSTILHADRIYVLEKGNLAEQGTHEALIAEKGLYYAMWRQQIGERKSSLNVMSV
jgi:ATP-binding cassette subfamily B protein